MIAVWRENPRVWAILSLRCRVPMLVSSLQVGHCCASPVSCQLINHIPGTVWGTSDFNLHCLPFIMDIQITSDALG